MTEENKYAFLLYVLISVGVIVTMTLISTTRAEAETFTWKIKTGETLIIKNKCFYYGKEDPAGWPCYNESQGLPNLERLERYMQIRKRAIKQGVDFVGIVVILNDPKCNRNRCDYNFHAVGNKAYLPLMDCPQDFSEGIRVLKAASRNSKRL